MPRVRATTAILAAGLCVAGLIPADAAGTATCVRELARAENSLVKTLVRVRGAAQAKGGERCSTYQDHAAIIGKAREVFARCKSGTERDKEVTQLDGVLTDANAVIAKVCSDL